MTREEEKQLLADLVFANQQLRDNLRQLQKFDTLTQKVHELEKIDTAAIAKQIQEFSAEQLINDIYHRINLKMTQTDKRINMAEAALQESAQKLKDGAKELNETSSNLMQLDVIAKSIQKVEDYNKSYKVKTMYGAVIVALITGIFTGGILAYSKSTVQDEAAPWLEFAAQNNAKVEKNFETQEYYISIPQNSRIVDGKTSNNRYVIIFKPKQGQK